MVAPALIAGLGVIVSGIASAVMGKSSTVYFVVRLMKGGIQDGTVANVAGKPFTDVDEAEKWQEKLSARGQASILVQRVTGKNHHGRTYTALHPVQAMQPAKKLGGLGKAFAIAPPGYWLVKWRAPGSTVEHLEVFQWEREAKERERDLFQMAAWVTTSMIPRTKRTETHPAAGRKMGSFKPPLDTKDQQEEAMLITTRYPAAKRFLDAKNGPFPETAIYNDDELVKVPLFDDTVSSHMWESDVVPMKLPDRDFEKGVAYKQPEMMVVEQALQYPEGK